MRAGKVDSLRGYAIPNEVNVSVTRNYGETAKHKSDELLKHLFLATLSVTLLVAVALGWREAGVVLLAIPVTLALTLFIFYLYGYTLNRVTLFALIFSIGILVDDAIVVVENIVRHLRLPGNHGRAVERRGGRSRGRGRQPDDPGDVCGDRRDFAHGFCARADGAVHAADSGRRLRGHALFADHRVCGFALGGAAS